MNCHYCHQECRTIQPGPLPNGLHENRLAHCDSCNVKYYKSFHVICCTIGNTEYSVSYMDEHPNHWTSIYQYNQKERPGIHDIALSFQFHVRFTPANFKDKLKTYLVFL